MTETSVEPKLEKKDRREHKRAQLTWRESFGK